jgi:metal-dependent hydrolase (beta-lactamase superfamily II)
MKKLGLDINKVKYVILSHAHADHDGGAKLLQESIPAYTSFMGWKIGMQLINPQTMRAANRSKTSLVRTE